MQDLIFTKFKKALPAIKRNVLLSKHTTFNIGGPAKYFLVTEKRAEIVKALKLTKKLGVPFFILGGGSNVLASDEGFAGLVVKIKSGAKTIKIKKAGKNFLVTAPAGIQVKDLVKFTVSKSLSGWQWAGGLPGTFGGAIRGNAGAFGGETKDSIVSVEVLDDQLQLRTLTNKQCNFAYRSSIIKQKNWIILSAAVQLQPGDKKEIQAIAQKNIQYRLDKHPLEYPSAGSVFKNVALAALSAEHQQLFSDKVKQDPFPIVPAAWFVIGAGMTGKQIGGAQVSVKHSNYIINLSKAKAKDVLDVISLNKQEVHKKYGVDLEPEVQFLET